MSTEKSLTVCLRGLYCNVAVHGAERRPGVATAHRWLQEYCCLRTVHEALLERKKKVLSSLMCGSDVKWCCWEGCK